MEEPVPIRYIKINDIFYLRAEDVGKYIRNVGDSEPTDTQNRLDEAATRMENVGKEP